MAATLRFSFDDEILRCDLQARSLDRDAAIRLWQELADRFPSLVTPYLRLGTLHLQANDHDAAIAALQTVLHNPQPTERAEAVRQQARGLLRFLQPGSATRP